MRLYTLEMLRAPCCRGPMRAEEGSGIEGQVLVCEACGGAYPVREGIPCLVHVDYTRLGDLTELLGHDAYRRIWLRTAQNTVCSEGIRKDYDRITAAAWRAFEQVLPEFDYSSPPRILDVGAGDGVTSALLAAGNAAVMAADLRLAALRAPGDVATRLPMGWLPEGKQAEARARLERAPYYADRVQASADRLPFADNLFDYVFCRAVLHHVSDVRKGIAEMARVLRRGGKLVVCAEPFRAGREAEFDRVKGTHDYLIGINEHYPRLTEYLAAFEAAGLGRPKLLTMDLTPALRWNRAPSPVRRAVERALRPLEWRRLPRYLAPVLRYCAGGISLVAVKRHHCPVEHTAGPRLLDPGLLDENPEHAPRLAQVVRELRRELPFPSRIETCQAPQEGLRLGWYPPEAMGPNVCARYSFPYCAATLRVPPGATTLTIRCRGLSAITGAPTRGVVRVNGADVGEFCLEAGEWQTLSFRLPGEEPIIDVEMETEEVCIPNLHLSNGDTRALGVAVAEIAAGA